MPHGLDIDNIIPNIAFGHMEETFGRHLVPVVMILEQFNDKAVSPSSVKGSCQVERGGDGFEPVDAHRAIPRPAASAAGPSCKNRIRVGNRCQGDLIPFGEVLGAVAAAIDS